MTNADEVMARIEADQVKTVDLRFTDLSGRWRHTSIDARSIEPETLARGIMIDGSAVAGWRDVAESDLLLKPDLESGFLDPFSAQPALIVLCDAADPATSMGYERDPRATAIRVAEYLAEREPALAALASVELGFFIFDDVRIERDAMRASYTLTSSESRSSAGPTSLSGSTGHRPPPGAAHLALSPADHHSDIRAEIASLLHDLGLGELRHEHGPSPCQHRLAFGKGGLVETCDRIQLAKYVIQQIAASYGKSATFMTKPLAGHPGAPLNLAVSLWSGEKAAFAGQGYADLSDACLNFIAGVLTHARALNAFTNPTTNSYKRLRESDEVPTLLTYAAHNRSAAIRIPFADKPQRKRVEIRFADPSANPYLALSGILLAGLDGIERKLQPGDAMDRNLYDLQPNELEGIPNTCRSLAEALDALEADHGFLTDHDIMPAELVEGYVEVKRQEIDRLDRLPTTAEMELYYSV